MSTEDNFKEKHPNAQTRPVIQFEKTKLQAGKSSKSNETAQDVLKRYNVSDYVDEAVKQIKAEEKFHKNAELNSKIVTKSTIKKDENVINPEIKSNFKTFEEEILESIYDSRKQKPLGKSRHNLTPPADVFDESKIYGKASKVGVSAYDVIFPRTSALDVDVNANVGHRNYVVSHGDYYPSERVDRRYNTKSFDHNESFGKRGGHEQTAAFLPEATETTIANEKQTDWRRKRHPEIGKSSKSNDNSTIKITKEESTITTQHLLYEETPDPNKAKFQEIENYLRKLRSQIRKKREIDLYEVRHLCKEMDSNNTGLLPLKDLTEIVSEYGVFVDTRKIREILELKKFMDDVGMCNYEKFIGFLESEEPIVLYKNPHCTKTKDYNTLTTYREFSNDVSTKKSPSDLRSAGLSSKRLDLECPKKPSSGFKGDIEMLGEETSVNTLISPSIPTMFGLSHRDYWLPRTKGEIRMIFTKIFKDLENDEIFDSIWQECLKALPSKSNKVSVEAFKLAMKSRQ